MKHLLMDPAFPDIVGAWARGEAPSDGSANDNRDDVEDGEFLEIFLAEIARREIDASRAW